MADEKEVVEEQFESGSNEKKVNVKYYLVFVFYLYFICILFMFIAFVLYVLVPYVLYLDHLNIPYLLCHT